MTEEPDAPITEYLARVAAGDHEARSQLVEATYEQLRRMALARVRREPVGNSIQTSDLAHDAYVRVLGSDSPSFDNRRHFFGAIAQAMRRILVEHARRKETERRGGGRARVPLDAIELPSHMKTVDLPALDDALERFEQIDPRAFEVIQLRFFLEKSVEEAAEILGISAGTVRDDWTSARAWLKRRMQMADDEA